MKSKIWQEIGWLLLPFPVIAGAVLWKNSAPVEGVAPPMPAPPIPAPTKPIVMPRMRLGAAQLTRMGPVLSQNLWRDEDFRVVVPFEMRGGVLVPNYSPSAPLTISMAEPYTVQMTGWTLSGSDGKSQTLNGWADFPVLKAPPSGRVPSQSINPAESNWLALGYQLDLDRVPASRGAVSINTRFVLSNGRVMPLKLMARPVWFTQKSKTLHLVRAMWRAPHGGDEGSVVVTVRSNGGKPLTTKNEPKGSLISWQVASALDGKPGRETITDHKLLHNWSPRLENASGKWNSHAAKDAAVWKRANAFLSQAKEDGQTMPVEKYLADFWPKIWAQTPLRRGAQTVLRYRLYGTKQFVGRPVFKTEIGVPGDGFLSVSLPLPRRVSSRRAR